MWFSCNVDITLKKMSLIDICVSAQLRSRLLIADQFIGSVFPTICKPSAFWIWTWTKKIKILLLIFFANRLGAIFNYSFPRRSAIEAIFFPCNLQSLCYDNANKKYNNIRRFKLHMKKSIDYLISDLLFITFTSYKWLIRQIYFFFVFMLFCTGWWSKRFGKCNDHTIFTIYAS